MRALTVLLALFAGACTLISGPDCDKACDQVLACDTLDKTFRLNCGSFVSACDEQEIDCADCIEDKSCEELEAGACDVVCGHSAPP